MIREHLVPRLKALGPLAKGVLIALAGGAIFAGFGLPAPWLSGGTISVAVAALVGQRMALPSRLRDVVFVLLGLSMGAGVTPASLARIGEWPLSLALLVATLVVVLVACQVYFVRFAGMDRLTAFFASIPGALSNVMAMALTTGADIPRIAISQTIRVVLLVAILPMLIAGTGVSLAPPVIEVLSLRDMALVLVCGVAGALLFQLIMRGAGGLLNGAFIASAILHGSGMVTGSLPMVVQNGCFIIIAVVIGIRFQGTELGLMRRTLGASLMAFAISVGVSAIGMGLVLAFSDQIPVGAAMLAFAPGGVEAMMALSFALDLDPAYVATHHLVRFGLMALGMPLMLVLAVPAGERGRKRGP